MGADNEDPFIVATNLYCMRKTNIAMWINLREGSSIKKIIIIAMSNEISLTNQYRRQSINLNQSLE